MENPYRRENLFKKTVFAKLIMHSDYFVTLENKEKVRHIVQ